MIGTDLSVCTVLSEASSACSRATRHLALWCSLGQQQRGGQYSSRTRWLGTQGRRVMSGREREVGGRLDLIAHRVHGHGRVELLRLTCRRQPATRASAVVASIVSGSAVRRP
jgi:hypothetical protein